MDIVEMIKACKSDDELKELAESAIETYTIQANQENRNEGYIGTKLDINPINYHIAENDFELERFCDAVPIWNGYIPLGTKIVYGRSFNEKFKTSSHRGCYYYVDDDSYIYEFFKFIKDRDIEDDYDIIIAVASFINKKMTKLFEPKKREDINKLIYMNEDLFFRPVKEHGLRDFYGNGSAMCSEISLMAENLVSSLGLEIMYFMDKEHVYNIYAHHEEDKTDVYVIDFSNWVECFDVNFNFIGYTPFFGKIEGADKAMLEEIVNEGKRIDLPDYFLYKINGYLYEIKTGNIRNYGTDFAAEEEKTLKKKKKKKY